MPNIYLVSGERSGDRHGAGLMEALRHRAGESWNFQGLGGPQMRQLSAEIRDWVEEAGVVGLWEVLRKYGWFRRQFAGALADILRLQPAAVILIDYPGFNLRLAKALRHAGFRGKVIYYISPQVWAWHRSRIPKMAKLLDLMLCIFPFEKELYEGCGLTTRFTGHPLVAWHQQNTPALPRHAQLVGLFPGSRRREVTKHFPVLLEAAQRLGESAPELRFTASAASPRLAVLMQEMLDSNPVHHVTIETGNAHQLMRQCAVGAVASGTATLEAAILGLPYCLIYKVAWPTYVVGRAVIRVPWLGIVNILAQRELVKELLQQDCTGAKVAAEMQRLYMDAEARSVLSKELAQVVAHLGEGDAYGNAATAIGEALR